MTWHQVRSRNSETVVQTLKKLADSVDGKVVGDPGCIIERVATLQNAGAGDISFLANRQYAKFLKQSHADAVIVCARDLSAVPKHAIVVSDPYVAYAGIAQILYPADTIQAKIEASAQIHNDANISSDAYVGANVVVSEGVSIASGCYIGPGCVIGKSVTIGENTSLLCNVTILKKCQIGARVLIHPGAVIGADGFGLANDAGKWLKIPQIGRVIIGDDVEIGANTTIDCGAIGDTTIGIGVKLDNLIQIGHNVTIGAHTVVASSTAIAGSTQIGQHCAIGGKVGIVGHLEIVDNVQIMGMSQVTQSLLSPGAYASGTAVQAKQDWHRNVVRFKQLDDMARRIKKLEKQLGATD